MPLDWTKPLQRNNHTARLLGVIKPDINQFTHVIAIDYGTYELVTIVRADGTTFADDPITNAPPPIHHIEGWVAVNRYKDRISFFVCNTRESAVEALARYGTQITDGNFTPLGVKLISFDITENEGLTDAD